MPGTESAGNRDIVVHYTSDGDRRRLELDWEIMLYAPDDTTTSRCA